MAGRRGDPLWGIASPPSRRIAMTQGLTMIPTGELRVTQFNCA